jgi:hypothetical protein
MANGSERKTLKRFLLLHNKVVVGEHMRNVSFVTRCIAICCICFILPGALSRAEPISDIHKVVTEFYEYHLKHDMGFTEENIQQRQKWLTSNLYQRIIEVQRKPSDPNVVPHITGDPFTDSQEYPNNFQIESVRLTKGVGSLKVVFKDDGADQSRTKWVIVRLRSGNGVWKIFDIKYQDGGTFLQDLKLSLSKASYK